MRHCEIDHMILPMLGKGGKLKLDDIDMMAAGMAVAVVGHGYDGMIVLGKTIGRCVWVAAVVVAEVVGLCSKATKRHHFAHSLSRQPSPHRHECVFMMRDDRVSCSH